MSNPKLENNGTEAEAEADADEAGAGDTGRAIKKPKVAVEDEMLTVLRAGYQKHYSEYSRWKKNVTQKLPGKVWKGVYKDYVNKMKSSHEDKGSPFSMDDLPTERTLQDALRTVISKEGTGTSVDVVDGAAAAAAAEKTALLQQQSDETVLKQLKEAEEFVMCRRLTEADSRARRNLIRAPSTGVGVSSTTSPDSQTKGGTEEASEPETPVQVRARGQSKAGTEEEGPEASEPETAAQTAARVAASLEKIARAVSENGTHMLQFFQIQVEVSSKKLELAAKAHQKDMVMKELQKLAFLRDNAIISAEEFVVKARQAAAGASS